MDVNFDCPVCRADNWESVRRYRYGKSDKTCSDGGPITRYLALRRRVLFDVWFPDIEEVVLESLLCRGCGFMCFSPRPSTDDIDAKYRFLQVVEKDIGGQRSDRKSLERDRKRAHKVFEVIKRYAPDDKLRVLDVGGGNGRILIPFIEQGHDCYLVDYNVNPIKGVNKIADRLEDVPLGNKYDVVICSHVIEHLAEPAVALKQMADLIEENGVIYGEVPLGVWGGIGIENDPVTHVNFFTRASFETLFRIVGLGVREARQTVGTYNRRIDVVYIVAGKGDGTDVQSLADPEEARRLLNQSFLMKLMRMWRLKRHPWA